MKRIFTILSISLAAAVSGAQLKYTRTVDTPQWNHPRPGKAFKKVKLYAERQPYKPNQNFLHRFIDRPLFSDVSLREDLEKNGFLKDVEIVKNCGYDGFAAIAYESLHRQHLKFLEEAKVQNYEHAVVLGADGGLNPGVIKNFREKLILAGKSPYTARWEGKIICWNYGSCNPKVLADLEKIVKLLREDKEVPPFLLVSELSFLSMYNAYNKYKDMGQKVPAEEVESFRKQLRHQLAVFDGVQLRVIEHYPTAEYPWRTLPTELYEEYLLPVLKEEFGKPEHKGKLTGIYARQSYVNHLMGSTYGEFGTEMLRAFLTGAAKMNPDIIMVFEWNEANENTSFQPTVANGRMAERLVNYAASCYNGEDPAPRPGDDVTIPNMIFSVPQRIRLGEVLHIELLNVPDTVKSSEISAVVSLFGGNGKKIMDLPAEKFDRKELRAVTWRFPAEQLAPYQAINYELRLVENGKKTVWKCFDATKVMTSSNIRYKFTRAPLREVLKPEDCKFDVKLNADGTYTVDAEFISPEELASLEVVDSHEEVYSLDRTGEFKGKTVIRGQFTAMDMVGTIAGRLSVPGVNGWKIRSLEGCMFEHFYSGFTIKNEMRVRTYFTMGPRANFVLTIPEKEMAKNPKFKVCYKGQPDTEFDLATVIKEGKYAKMIGDNIRLELFRADNLVDYPEHLNAVSGMFRTIIRPSVKFPLVHLRAVSKSGKIYRSKSVVLRSDGKAMENMTIWSETLNKPVTVSVAKDRIPDIRLSFDPAKGLFMGNSEAPEFDVSLGGGYTYSQPMAVRVSTLKQRKLLPETFTKPYPEWATDGNRNILRFNGNGEYLMLTRDALPRSSPYKLSFEIRRDGNESESLIRSTNFGGMSSFNLELYIEKNILKAVYHHGKHYYRQAFDTGLSVPMGQWTAIEVEKSADTITFKVDGKSKSFPFTGRGTRFNMSIFGGPAAANRGVPEGLSCFKGDLREFRIRHNN